MIWLWRCSLNLRRIEKQLVRSDAGLAGLFSMFNALAEGEDLPKEKRTIAGAASAPAHGARLDRRRTAHRTSRRGRLNHRVARARYRRA